MENKFMQKLQHFGEVLANNKFLSALTGSMMGMIAVIMVGAVFQILAVVPTLFGWATTESTYYQRMMVPYNMTMGLLSVVLAFALGYNYAKNLGLKPIQNGINAMLLFLMVAAPVQTVILEGGASFSGLSSSNLGGTGLFSAILVAFVAVQIDNFCEKRNIKIKMPDVVPQFLSDSFNALLPFLFNVVLWYCISLLINGTTGITLPDLITSVLAKPLAALTSVPGMLVILFFITLLWFFGIHGTLVALSALMPVLLQAYTANADLVAKGQDPVFYPVFLFWVVASAGGTGNTLSLVLMGLRSKSEQIRAVSKVALVPGIFNINEPVTFGFPIMYNPILAIPYILNPILTAIVTWIGFAIGFFKPPYIAMMTVLPVGVMEFLTSLAWQNLLIPVLAIAISWLVYYPFLKIYEKQLVEKEQATKAQTAVAD